MADSSLEVPLFSFPLAAVRVSVDPSGADVLLGAGGFGKVFVGQCRLDESATWADVAIKALRAGGSTEDLERELKKQASFQHKNISRLFGVVRDGPLGKLAAVIELGKGGNLLKRLMDREGPPPSLAQRMQWSIQLAWAVAYVHDQGSCHADISPTQLQPATSFSKCPIPAGTCRRDRQSRAA